MLNFCQLNNLVHTHTTQTEVIKKCILLILASKSIFCSSIVPFLIYSTNINFKLMDEKKGNDKRFKIQA